MSEDRLVKLYMRVFETEDGIKVLKNLMKDCNVMNGTYNGDPHIMYYNEGRRSVVFDILKVLHINLARFKELNEELEEEQWQKE